MTKVLSHSRKMLSLILAFCMALTVLTPIGVVNADPADYVTLKTFSIDKDGIKLTLSTGKSHDSGAGIAYIVVTKDFYLDPLYEEPITNGLAYTEFETGAFEDVGYYYDDGIGQNQETVQADSTARTSAPAAKTTYMLLLYSTCISGCTDANMVTHEFTTDENGAYSYTAPTPLAYDGGTVTGLKVGVASDKSVPAATGGTSPYTYSTTDAATLATYGLTLNTDGTISGTPTKVTAGTGETISVTAKDSAATAAEATKDVTIVIGKGDPVVTLPDFEREVYSGTALPDLSATTVTGVNGTDLKDTVVWVNADTESTITGTEGGKVTRYVKVTINDETNYNTVANIAVEFTIKPTTAVSIEAFDSETYSGSAITLPTPTIKADGKELTTDEYKGEWTKEDGSKITETTVTNAGTYTFTITELSLGYTGVGTSANFVVNQLKLSKPTVTITENSATENGFKFTVQSGAKYVITESADAPANAAAYTETSDGSEQTVSDKAANKTYYVHAYMPGDGNDTTDSDDAYASVTTDKLTLSDANFKVDGEYTYNGKEQTPKVVPVSADGVTEADITVTSAKQTDAGTYSVTISVKETNNYKATTTDITLTNAWKINKKVLTFTADKTAETISKGEEKTLAFTLDGVVDGDTDVVSYGYTSGDNNYVTFTDSKVKGIAVIANAVTVTATATVQDGNYTFKNGETEVAEATAEVAITVDEGTENTVTFANPAEEISVQYGTPVTNTATDTAGGKVKYDSSNKEVATVDASGNVTILKVGTTTITAYVEAFQDLETGTFYAYDEDTYTLKVTEKELSISTDITEAQIIKLPDGTINLGDGDFKVTDVVSPDVAGSIYDVTYSVTAGGDYATVAADTGVVTATAAGTATITATLTKDVGATNYKVVVETATIDVKVEKATVTLPTFDVANATYNGKPIDTTAVPTQDTQGLASVTVKYEGINNTTYDSPDAPTNAGDYKVTISIPETNADYTATPVSDTFTINKAALNWAIDNVDTVKAIKPYDTFATNVPVTGSLIVEGVTVDENTETFTATVKGDKKVDFSAADVFDEYSYELAWTDFTVEPVGSANINNYEIPDGKLTYTNGEIKQVQADDPVIKGDTSVAYGSTITLSIDEACKGDGAITWEITEGADYAEIDQSGVITVKKSNAAGAATVKVSATRGDGTNYSAAENKGTYTVTITKKTVIIASIPLTCYAAQGNPGIDLTGPFTVVSATLVADGAPAPALTFSVTATGDAAITGNTLTFTQAGTGTVTATVDPDNEYYSGSTTENLTINNAITLTGEWANTTTTYGTALAPEFTPGVGDAGIITYEYSTDGGQNYTSAVPTNKGDYYVRAVPGNTDKYSPSAGEPVKISKKSITLTVTASKPYHKSDAMVIGNLAKTTLEKDDVNTGIVDGDSIVIDTFTAKFDNENVHEDLAAKEIAVDYAAGDADNYDITLNVKGSITQKNIALTATATKTYDGNPAMTKGEVTLDANGNIETGDSIEIDTLTATYSKADVHNGEPAKVTKVTYTGTGSGNYNVESLTITGTIEQKVVYATAIDKAIDTKVGTAANMDTDNNIAVKGKTDDVAIGTSEYEVEYTVTNDNGTGITAVEVAPTAAGTAAVKATITLNGNSNYKFEDNTNVATIDDMSIVVTKTAVTLDSINNDNATYIGTPIAHSGVYTTKVVGDDTINLTVTYTGKYLDADGVEQTYNSTDAPTNVGTYTVTIAIPGTEAKYEATPVSATLTIGKANLTWNDIATDGNKVTASKNYNGNGDNAAVSGSLTFTGENNETIVVNVVADKEVSFAAKNGKWDAIGGYSYELAWGDFDKTGVTVNLNNYNTPEGDLTLNNGVINKVQADDPVIKGATEVAYGSTITLSIDDACKGDGDITWEITAGNDYATIDEDSGEITVIKSNADETATITVTATRGEGDNYLAAKNAGTYTVAIKKKELAITPAVSYYEAQGDPGVNLANDIKVTTDLNGLQPAPTLGFVLENGNTAGAVLTGTTLTFTQAGTGTITATVDPTSVYYKGSKPVTLTVTETKPITGKWDKTTTTYGTPLAPEFTIDSSITDAGNITYEYSTDNGGSYTTTVPTDVGSYLVRAVPGNTDKYSPSAGETVTISKKEITLEVSASRTYGKSDAMAIGDVPVAERTLTNAEDSEIVAGDTIVIDSLDSSAVYFSEDVHEDEVVTVVANYTGADNYDITLKVSGTITVKPITLDVEASREYEKGNDDMVIADLAKTTLTSTDDNEIESGDNIVITEFTADFDNANVHSNLAAKNVSVKYADEDAKNYKITLNVKGTIEQKEVAASADPGTASTTVGTAANMTEAGIVVKADGEAIDASEYEIISYTVTDGGTTGITAVTDAPTATGTATVKATVKLNANSNYKFAGNTDTAEVTVYIDVLDGSFTVEFYANGGEGTMNSVEYHIGSATATLPANNGSITKADHKFIGWSYTAGENSVTYADNALMTDTTTDGLGNNLADDDKVKLYAVWAPTYALEVVLGEGGKEITINGNAPTGTERFAEDEIVVIVVTPKDNFNLKTWTVDNTDVTLADATALSQTIRMPGGAVKLETAFTANLTITAQTAISKKTNEVAGLKVSDFITAAEPRFTDDTIATLFDSAIGALTDGAVTADGVIITFYTDDARTTKATAITKAGTYYYTVETASDTAAANTPKADYNLQPLAATNGTLTVTARSTGGGGGGATSYTVTYDAGANGTLVGDKTEKVSAGRKPVKVPTVTANEGYKFVGWSLTAGGKTVDPTTETIRKLTTFYAVYEKVDDTTPVVETYSHSAYMLGYEDGSFRPDNGITRAEVATMFARLDSIDLSKTYTTSFTDVSASDWYAPYIGYMAETGIINGYEDGSFRPNAQITRAEFAAIASRYAGFATGEENIFSDVADEFWAKDNILAAYECGWISGYPDGTFKPMQSISRAEVVQLANAMLGRLIDASNLGSASYKKFSDVSTSHWAYYQIIEASNDHNYTKENDKEIWVK